MIDIEQNPIYTVSELNREAKRLLEHHFVSVQVEGEISNLSRPHSGHLYFSLKDQGAQVSCAMFRSNNLRLSFDLTDGLHVVATARVSLYENRGQYQLIVQSIEPAGDGALRRAFEALKKRLAQEGLFAEEAKKPIPTLPRRIGVVTSATGAAIRDILSVLKRRFPAIPVIIYPSEVQGSEAAGKLVRAIEVANQRQECDVLILARGGGSLEDLWPFNEEKVARAIYASKIPIVSGVGHEVDVTIADFVADHRAPTPSAAAELITPLASQWLEDLQTLSQQLTRTVLRQLQTHQQHIDFLTKRLQHPAQRLAHNQEQLAHAQLSLKHAIQNLIHRWQKHQQQLTTRLVQQSPQQALQQIQLGYQLLCKRLIAGIEKSLSQKSEQWRQLMHTLNAVSPLATLDRGYAIVSNEQGKIIKDKNQVKIGQRITARLPQAHLHCTVDAIDDIT